MIDQTQQRRIKALLDAEREANRFADLAHKAAVDLENKSGTWAPSKPYAAAKRASLDLTNALVRVRYPEGRS